MRIHARAPTLFVVGLVALAGCVDGSTGPEPAAGVEPPAPVARAVPVDATRAAATEAATPEVSAGLRAAMATTLTVSLEELDLQPAAPMSMLHDFFRDVEARRGNEAPTRSDRPRTVHR